MEKVLFSEQCLLWIKRELGFSRDKNKVMLPGWQFAFGGMVMLLIGYLLGDRVSSFTLVSTFLLVYLIFISAVVYTL